MLRDDGIQLPTLYCKYILYYHSQGKRHLRNPPEPKRTSSDLVTRPEKAARTFAEDIDLSTEKVSSDISAIGRSNEKCCNELWGYLPLLRRPDSRVGAPIPRGPHVRCLGYNEQLQCENKTFSLVKSFMRLMIDIRCRSIFQALAAPYIFCERTCEIW